MSCKGLSKSECYTFDNCKYVETAYHTLKKRAEIPAPDEYTNYNAHQYGIKL